MDQACGGNRNLHDLAVDLAFNCDQANSRDQLAILREQNILHRADIAVVLLVARLEPAKRRCASTRSSGLLRKSGNRGGADGKSEGGQGRPQNLVCRKHHTEIRLLKAVFGEQPYCSVPGVVSHHLSFK